MYLDASLKRNHPPRQKEMEITEKWLGEIGGWQAMKAARALVEGGHVTVQSAEPGRIRGLAGGGKTKFASGLTFSSRTNVENLCTCPTARRGMICEHALAVVLAHIQGPKKDAETRRHGDTEKKPALSASAPLRAFASSVPLRLPGSYTIFLPENLLTGTMREPVGTYVRYAPGGEGEESLLAAWLAEKGVRAQSAPMSLPSAVFDDFLRSAAEHPRVIAGKPSGGGLPLSIAREPVRLLITAESKPGDKEVSFRFADEGQLPLIKTRPTGAWFCRETQSLFQVPALTPECATLLRELPTRRPLRWLISQREALNDAFQLELRGAGLAHFHCVPVPCKFTLHLDGSLQAVEAVLRAEFGGKGWLVGESGPRCAAETLFPFEDTSTTGLFYLRNESGEARLMALMESLGFQLGTRVEAGGHTLVWKLTKPEAVLQLYATDLPRLRREMKVIEGERWLAATRGVARITPQIHRRESDDDRRSGQDWLAMEFAYEAPDGFRLPRAEVLRLVAAVSAASRRRMANATSLISLEWRSSRTRCAMSPSSSPPMAHASVAFMRTTSSATPPRLLNSRMKPCCSHALAISARSSGLIKCSAHAGSPPWRKAGAEVCSGMTWVSGRRCRASR
jgi:hypothetical protein